MIQRRQERLFLTEPSILWTRKTSWAQDAYAIGIRQSTVHGPPQCQEHGRNAQKQGQT